MPFRVFLSPQARADIDSAVTWLARADKTVAARWRAGLLSVIADLETNPTKYPLADEAADLGVDLRVRPYGRRRGVYRVLFVLEADVVNVLRVYHSARDRLTSDDI